MHAPRLNALELAPEGYAALRGVEGYIARCGLEKPLIASGEDAGLPDQRLRVLPRHA